MSQATCRGGSFRVERVAGFAWNQWPGPSAEMRHLRPDNF
ncbi:hypothetical protein MRBBS_0424 [Marinobacter sp. BSs20148]|nr:hypothetical protein MRBBS_0424 [Marinobacter sp. BSs20148]